MSQFKIPTMAKAGMLILAVLAFGAYGDEDPFPSLTLLELAPEKPAERAPDAFPSLSLLEVRPGIAPLSPALEPESHDKFFDHDYPDDARVAVHKGFNFQHPYPVMQDSEDYDKDYTKDENSDGGQWKAQTAYDALRAKKSSKVIAAKKAWEAAADLEKELEVAKENRAAAEKAAAEASARAEDAKKVASNAEERAKVLASATAMKEEIDSSVAVVEGDVDNLEDCKKKLSEAKDHLKALMHDREDHEGERAVAAEQAQERAVTDQQAAAELSNAAAEKAAAAKDLWSNAAAEDKDLMTKIAAAGEKADALAKEASVGDDELHAAAVHLRGVRHSEVDDDGGVYYHHPPAPTAAPYVPPPPRPTLPPPVPQPKSGTAGRTSLLIPAAAAVLFAVTLAPLP